MTSPTKAPQENNLAVASLILGIISVVGFGGALTGIPAMITGFMSLKNPTNKNLGIIGLVLGAVATILSILVILLIVFVVFLGVLSAGEGANSTPDSNQYDSTYYSEQRT